MNTIEYDNLFFHCNDNDEFNVNVKITETIDSDSLWGCKLMGLWKDENERGTLELERVWDIHVEGDYFQQIIMKHNYSLRPNFSYTALFHELLRERPNELFTVNNLYSTSKLDWLSMGFTISPAAEQFWTIQTENNLAVFMELEQRYRALP